MLLVHSVYQKGKCAEWEHGVGEECRKCLEAEKKPSSIQPLAFLTDSGAFMRSISSCDGFAVAAAFQCYRLSAVVHYGQILIDQLLPGSLHYLEEPLKCSWQRWPECIPAWQELP